MTIPSWPSKLPQFVLAEGYSETFAETRFKVQTEIGPGRMRYRALTAKPVACLCDLDWRQKSRFERFWDEELNHGVLPFIIPDQTHHRQPLLTDEGEALLADGELLLITAYWLVTFQSPPRLTPWDIYWTASFDLNVLPV